MHEAHVAQGWMLKGRQILWMMHEYRKLDEERGSLYDFHRPHVLLTQGQPLRGLP